MKMHLSLKPVVDAAEDPYLVGAQYLRDDQEAAESQFRQIGV